MVRLLKPEIALFGAGYQAIIDRLAQQFDAPTFLPHVTLYSGEYTPEENISDLIDAACCDIRSFSGQIKSIQQSPEYTKTLFVQLERHPSFNHLCESIRQRSRQQSKFSLNPHLSLMYKSLDNHKDSN